MLRALGLFVDDVPRRAGVVPFGRADRPVMPQCLYARVRFEHLDGRRFNGNVFTLLGQAERFLLDALPMAGRAGRFIGSTGRLAAHKRFQDAITAVQRDANTLRSALANTPGRGHDRRAGRRKKGCSRRAAECWH